MKKYGLKRTLAFISALSIIGSYSQTIGAFNSLSYNTISAAATDDSNNENVNPTDDKKYSRIDIEISNQYDFRKNIDCKVSVFKVKSDGSESAVLSDSLLTVGGEKNSTATISTDYIENGTYIVEIRAEGFKTFRQEISNFDNMVCTLNVTLGFQHGYDYTAVYKYDENGEQLFNPDGDPVLDVANDKHPGAMIVGDVNGDGEITKRDEELLLEAIDYSIRNNNNVEVELHEHEVLSSDLNRDGVTNLADLTFFTKGYFDTIDWSTYASVTKEVSEKYKTASIKKAEPVGETVIQGDIKNLLKDSKKSNNSENNGENTDNTVVEEAPLLMQPEAIEVINENGEPEMVIPEISEEHPVGIALEFDDDIAKFKTLNLGSNFEIGDLAIEAEGVDEPIETPFAEGTNFLSESDVTVKVDASGNLSLDLGNQIAVKKITIKITKVKDINLAKIGTVEFLNGMEERIAPPAIDYPLNLKVVQDCNVRDKDAKIIASWDKCVNVEGYEFEVSTSSATKPDGSFASTIPGVQNTIVAVPEFMLQSEHGNFKLIKINTTYYVHVRSVADDYRSAWSDYAKVTTVSNGVPDKPDYVNATGAYKSVKVTWGSDNTNTTQGYKLYYKKSNAAEYNEINVGKTTSYTITDLDDLTEYEVYVIGYNSKGDSAQSVHSAAMTTTLQPVQMLKYNVINCDDDGKVGSAHIVSVTRNGGEVSGNEQDFINIENRNKAVSAANEIKNKNERTVALNTAYAQNPFTAWSVVDDNTTSYYVKKNWDDGGFNGLGSNGLTFEFDDEYEIGSFAVANPFGTTNYCYIKLKYWDANNQVSEMNFSYCTEGTKDVNKNGYHIVKFPRKVNAKKIQIGIGNSSASGQIAISEIYFYAYDHTMDDIMNLYVDNLHTVLRAGVTQATIDELREKINAPDPRTGEFNPNQEALERELATAEKILNAEQISKPILIHNTITTNDPIESGTSRRYNGLNAWQPLGVSIGTNSEVTIYVGCPTKKTGEGTDLRLIATQYNSESNSLTLDGANLKVGANTFTLTKGNIAGAEAGGALYIQYQGTSGANVQYSVRVTGGSEVPILDLYKITDREERLSKAADYIEALDKYVANMEKEHNRVHKGATYNGQKNTKLDYDYDQKTCIAGATDILCDTMMYSLPAPQILEGLGKGTTEQRAETLITSMESMEDMMKLFYQHKGMSADAANVVNRIPNQHLNIRYQRMFSGASMYAAANHIGIQWGSAPSMVNSKGVTADKDGKYVSGGYFGWGIAHEIGHCLNDSSYTVAEITNNYYALLAQSKDKNDGGRLNYTNIFKKTTSNIKGNADQGTQLGIYWQLHLAYDKPYNFKTYDTNKEILDNLFYARMDTYSRNPSKAPAPNGISLTLSGGTDQQLMRLACAASEKNVLEFFERWGKTPNTETKSYASQFEKEKRAIMYANDDSRIYAMKGESSLVDKNGEKVSVIDDVKVSVGKGTEANKVTIKIDVDSEKINEKDILGYEIIRRTISGGDVKETPIGFATGKTFTDTVTSLNNRTVSYKVTLIDHYLNRSVAFDTDMVKIQHDGSLDKTHWSISTSGLSATSIVEEATEELPCSHTIIDPAKDAIDDNLETVYAPKVTNNNAEIILNFNESLVVTGMKYKAGEDNSISEYNIFVKGDAENEWISVANGTFNGSDVVYFSNTDDKYISTYETTAVKLQILNQNKNNISIAELDVLGVTGDNVDFRKDGETKEAVFGILSEDYKYGTKANDFIPKDSLVFTGSYKGNPAYNAVILFDEEGNIVGGTGVDDEGKAQQIILADVPDGSLITDVSNGTWVYWINPEDIANMVWPKKVRVELYRVNNAVTNEGQRIVSDSLFETISSKDKISSITIGGNRKYTTTTEDTTESTTANDTEITTETTTATTIETTTKDITEVTTESREAEVTEKE
ncbi:MAG: M60 family metallopeptidase [Ruminococcus sp.]|nr:M60 family metallopeptidase [Ruminococcus sp.]